MNTLSWKPLIGIIDFRVPTFVLAQLCKSYGFRFESNRLSIEAYKNKVIRRINEYQPPKLKRPFSGSDLGLIARFINYKEKWSKTNLLRAFTKFQEWQEHLVLSPGIRMDVPTEKHPEAISDIVLYVYARKNNLEIPSNILSHQFRYRIRIYINSTKRELINQLIEALEAKPKDYIINRLWELQERPIISFKKLQEIGNRYRRQYSSIEQMSQEIPNIPEELVVYAAIIHRKDITDSEDFRYALKNKLGIPLDQRFNPNLPECLYTIPQLRALAIREGYTNKTMDENNPYRLLQESYIQDTFHLGIHESINTSTILGDSVVDLPTTSLVYYGNRPLEEGPMIVFSYEELCRTFEHDHNFKNPRDNYFSRLTISKLLYICEQDQLDEETPEEYQVRSQLVETIEQILMIQDNFSPSEMNLLNSPEKHRRIYVEIMTLIMQLGMYVRGWTSPDKYPIKKPLNFDYNIMEPQVWEKLKSLSKVFERYPVQSEIILKLPLVKRINKIYVVEKDEDVGTTIGEKLQIMDRGGENTNACIRSSSNYLIGSTYKYLTLIGSRPDFDIDRLRPIF